MRQGTDWEKLKLEYVHGADRLRDVAERYGVTYRAVKRRSAAEGWVEQRREYRERQAARRAEAAEIEAQKLAVADGATIAQQNDRLGEEFYQLALMQVIAARNALKPSEIQIHAITAGIATDKWRLLTEQATNRYAHSDWWEGIEELENEGPSDPDITRTTA